MLESSRISSIFAIDASAKPIPFGISVTGCIAASEQLALNVDVPPPTLKSLENRRRDSFENRRRDSFENRRRDSFENRRICALAIKPWGNSDSRGS